jgi:hypothetical protein
MSVGACALESDLLQRLLQPQVTSAMWSELTSQTLQTSLRVAVARLQAHPLHPQLAHPARAYPAVPSTIRKAIFALNVSMVRSKGYWF